MANTVILGLGNDLLGDDAIGLRVVEEVRNRLGPDPRVELHVTTETGPALLDYLVGCDAAVVVDAIHTGEHPAGFIQQIEPTVPTRTPACSPHRLGIAQLCALGRERGLATPAKLRLIGIEIGAPTRFGTALSPAVEASIPDAVDAVIDAALEIAAHGLVPEGPSPAGGERETGGVRNEGSSGKR